MFYHQVLPYRMLQYVGSAVGLLAVDPVGIFPWLSTALMMLPCFNLNWTHRTIVAGLVYGIASHLSSVVSRLWFLKDNGGVDCMVEVLFDVPPLTLPSSCSSSFI
jgi:hypothetical protein